MLKNSAILAVFISLLVPGLGLARSNQIKKFLTIFVAFFVLTVPYCTVTNVYAYIAIHALLITIFWLSCIASYVYFKKSSKMDRENSPGFLFYAAFTVVSISISIAAAANANFDIKKQTSRSMSPTIEPGDYIFIKNGFPDRRDISRGRIVVYTTERGSFISRIVGIPGDNVKMNDKKDEVTITTAEEHSKVGDEQTTSTTGAEEVHLEPDQYFLMGDNMSPFLDSRYLGPIERNNIIGEVVLSY